jgi:cobalt/nickel transport system permease protein
MHISEGILTGPSMAATLALGAAAVAWGATRVTKLIKDEPQRKPLLAMAGAFVFLLSLTPFPAGPGTTTHPCGTPLAAILLGPGPTVVLASLALLLQALFFAHGGLSSLGANTLTLGLVGGLTGWLTYHTARKAGLGIFASAALAGLLGDVLTYAAAGGILAGHLAFFGKTPQHDFAGYLKLIYLSYLPFQTPLAIGEALLTGFAIRAIARQRPEVLEGLGVEAKGFSQAAGFALLCFMVLAASGARAAEKAAAAPAPAAVSAAAQSPAAAKPAGFSGMDEVVNEAVAQAGGAPAHAPYIDFESKGDLWNFVLLMGGGLAGFVVGKNWHHLFGAPKA